MDWKYLAGFVEGDGHVGISPIKSSRDGYCVYSHVNLSQRTDRSGALKEVAEFYGVAITKHSTEDVFMVKLTGKKSVNFLQHLMPHTVFKTDDMRLSIDVNSLYVTKDELKSLRQLFKNLRNEDKDIAKSQLSRRWLAGYFDADGSIGAYIRTSGKGFDTRMSIASYINDSAILYKVKELFGGWITRAGKNGLIWTVNLNIGNVQRTLGYFSKHLRIKKPQAILVMDFVGKGKYLKTRGATHEACREYADLLSAMKKPQRLSDNHSV